MDLAEFPYWSAVELRECANGWVVTPAQGAYDRTATVRGPSDMWVFEDWEKCQRFMHLVTNPKRTGQPTEGGR